MRYYLTPDGFYQLLDSLRERGDKYLCIGHELQCVDGHPFSWWSWPSDAYSPVLLARLNIYPVLDDPFPE